MLRQHSDLFIDTDAGPCIPEFKLLGMRTPLYLGNHLSMGKITWDVARVKLFPNDPETCTGAKFRTHPEQPGKRWMQMRDALSFFQKTGQTPLNATVLEWLVSHPERIPSRFKGLDVYFLGTLYVDTPNDGPAVMGNEKIKITVFHPNRYRIDAARFLRYDGKDGEDLIGGAAGVISDRTPIALWT